MIAKSAQKILLAKTNSITLFLVILGILLKTYQNPPQKSKVKKALNIEKPPANQLFSLVFQRQ